MFSIRAIFGLSLFVCIQPAVAAKDFTVVALSGRSITDSLPSVLISTETSPPPVGNTPFSQLSMADNGSVAFSVELDRQFPWADDALCDWRPSHGLSLIARDGDPVQNSSGIYESIFSSEPLFSSVSSTNRGIVYQSWVDGSEQRVFLRNKDTQAIVQVGQPAPGTTGVIQGNLAAVSNDRGDVLVRATYVDLAQNVFGDYVMWLDSDNGLEPIALENQIAPGVGKPFKLFRQMAINNAGSFAFSADYDGLLDIPGLSGTGVWTTSEDGLRLVADLGHQSLPTAVYMNNIGDVVFQNSHRETFYASASSSYDVRQISGATTDEIGGLSDTGIVAFGSSTEISLVDQFGSVHPVANSGQNVSGLPTEFELSYFGSPVINASGTIVFASYFDVPGGFGQGVFAKKPDGVLQPIAVSGQVVDVGIGGNSDLRTFSRIDYGGLGEGPSVVLNAQGVIAFLAVFTDGSSAVLVSRAIAIPEPATMIHIALVTVCSSLRRRRFSGKHCAGREACAYPERVPS
jgi:hypothetical protein